MHAFVFMHGVLSFVMLLTEWSNLEFMCLLLLFLITISVCSNSTGSNPWNLKYKIKELTPMMCTSEKPLHTNI